MRGWGSSISEEVPRDGPDASGRRVPPVRKGLSVERWGETALSLFSISYLTVKQARLAGGRPRRVMAFTWVLFDYLLQSAVCNSWELLSLSKHWNELRICLHILRYWIPGSMTFFELHDNWKEKEVRKFCQMKPRRLYCAMSCKKRLCSKDCPSLKNEIWDKIWNVWEPPSFHVYHFEFWCMGDFLALYSEHKKGTLYHGLQKIVPAKSDLPILQDLPQFNTDQFQWNSLQFNLWQKKLALSSLEGIAAIFWQG